MGGTVDEADETDAGEALDAVEAALWRLGVGVAGVDEVLALAGELARTVGERAAREGYRRGLRVGQDRRRLLAGERLSQGVGARVDAEPLAELAGSVEPEPEPAAELAGKQAGSAAETGFGELSDTEGASCQLTRAPVSTAPDPGSVQGPVKACSSCGARLPLDRFYRDANKDDGRRGTCKGCEGTRRRVRRRELAAVRWLLASGADPEALLAAAERRVPHRRLRPGETWADVARAEAEELDREALADALRAAGVRPVA